jgi:AraC-like DNA-binding protein
MEVNDFACASMIRLLTRGMEQIGLTPPVENRRGGSTVDLHVKRALVAHVLRERGPGALVRIGQAVHDMGVDPVLTMLVRAGSPRQVISRFQRLERFVHSRHRMVVEDSADNSMRMRHVSLVEGEPPLPAEDLVVLGVLIGFLQVAGCDGVSAHFDHGCMAFPDSGAVEAAFGAGYTDRWVIEWTSFAPTAAKPTREPELGLDSSPPVVRKIAHYCASDADTTLPAVAAKLNMSKRTLQRRLREAGYDFRAITGDVRNRVAAWWLAETDRSIAEIGFLCGYSDQAHFTRDFKHRNGPTPNAYRER